MLQSQSRLYQTNTFEIPPQFETFARTSIDVVQQAYTGTLEEHNAQVRLSNDRDAHRVFIERALPEASRDYEFIALHLGSTTLTVCMEHRHDFERRDGEYHRSSIVFDRGEVVAHHTNLTRLGPREVITHNEEVGHRMTDRLFHTLGSLGIATEIASGEFQRAS